MRSLISLVSLVVAIGLTPPAASHAVGVPKPQVYRLGPKDVLGWTVTRIGVSRRESNWRAWHDSRSEFLYFYRGPWTPLGRQTGWYERLSVSQGIAEAAVAVLVSQFASDSAAQHAYQAVFPVLSGANYCPCPVPLPIGMRAEEWQTNLGVASGPQGLAGYFGGFTTILLAGSVVAEIRADVAGKPRQVLRPPLQNPGRAIARHLALIAMAATGDEMGLPAVRAIDGMEGPAEAVTVSTVSHGIRLTLELPGREYPRAALVRAVARAQNVSSHLVYLWPPDGFGDGDTFPQAEVLDQRGRVRFPPALHPPFVGPDPGPMRVPLMPGQVIESRSFVVLWASQVRAVVFVDESDMFPGYKLYTPMVHVTLTRVDRPKARVTALPGTAVADFLPHDASSGRLHYMQWLECFYPGADHLGQDGVFLWSTSSTRNAAVESTGVGVRLAPLCPPELAGGRNGFLVQWHVIAGWPNHSVAIVNFPAA